MKTVCVMMSTYNGEKYVVEQIKSVLNQKGVIVKLIIRDDGSCDNTINTIVQIAQNSENVRIIDGENKGFVSSFITLLRESPSCEYYAFCDQDDIWKDDKLLFAIERIADLRVDCPVLYNSNTTLVDENLNVIRNEMKNPIVSLGSSMVKNFATGCTVVFNDALKKEIVRCVPDYVSSHDSWLCRVCLAVGGYVIFDKRSHMYYRQHSKNAVGSSISIYQKIRSRVNKMLYDKSHSRKKTARELIRLYRNKMSESNYQLLKKIANYDENIITRIQVIIDKELKCGNLKDDFLFTMAVLIGWI